MSRECTQSSPFVLTWRGLHVLRYLFVRGAPVGYHHVLTPPNSETTALNSEAGSLAEAR